MRSSMWSMDPLGPMVVMNVGWEWQNFVSIMRLRFEIGLLFDASILAALEFSSVFEPKTNAFA